MQVIEKEKILDDEMVKGNIYTDKTSKEISFKCFICNKPLHFPSYVYRVIKDNNGKVAISPFVPCHHCGFNYVVKNSNIITYNDKALRKDFKTLMTKKLMG